VGNSLTQQSSHATLKEGLLGLPPHHPAMLTYLSTQPTQINGFPPITGVAGTDS
jgi:hypothetical protein